MWPSNSSPGYTTQKYRKQDLKQIHMNVHGNAILTSQEVKKTQMSINGLMDKQNVVYSHGILFGH